MARTVMKPETVALIISERHGLGEKPGAQDRAAAQRRGFVHRGRSRQWSPGFLITVDQVPGKRSPGSLSWGSINNTYFSNEPSRGVSGVILMQYLPFADAKALAVYDAFERGAYQLVNANQ